MQTAHGQIARTAGIPEQVSQTCTVCLRRNTFRIEILKKRARHFPVSAESGGVADEELLASAGYCHVEDPGLLFQQVMCSFLTSLWIPAFADLAMVSDTASKSPRPCGRSSSVGRGSGWRFPSGLPVPSLRH